MTSLRQTCSCMFRLRVFTERQDAMNRSFSMVVILAVVYLAFSETCQGQVKYSGKQKHKVDASIQNGKPMGDTFGTIKPLSPSGSAKTLSPVSSSPEDVWLNSLLKTVADNPISWDGKKITFRSGRVDTGAKSFYVSELSYGTIDGRSNMYRVCDPLPLRRLSPYPVEGSNQLIVVYGDGKYLKHVRRIVFSGIDKDDYCETFKKIFECMDQAKRTRAKSFTKDIPCSVEGSSFVFEWTSTPLPPSGNALEIRRSIDSCQVILTKTNLVTKAVSTDIYNKPEVFGEFLKMLTSQDIVLEFDKMDGTPSDAEKIGKGIQ